MSLLPTAVTALQQIGHAVKNIELRWLVGGSCGLMLHNVPLLNNPRDLDLYADESQAACLHKSLEAYILDPPLYSETDIYRSTLSHYQVNGIIVELVGAFQIHSKQSVYKVSISEGLFPYALQVKVGDAAVSVMPLAHELVFNLLRDRPDRYERIARTMRKNLDHHLPAMKYIINNNKIHGTVIHQLEMLLGTDLAKQI